MALILIIRDEIQTKTVRITKSELTIGRSSSCHIKVGDEKVSGKHCSFRISNEGRVLVKDLGSSNGTFINSSSVTDAYLYLDDLLQIGSLQIQLDESAMTPKEREIHKKAGEQTKLHFISLDSTLSKTSTHDEDLSSSYHTIKQRVVKKGKEVEKAHTEIKDLMIKGKAFEKEASSGQTQFIKIARKPKTTKKKVTKKKAPKKQSLGEKLLGVFKKDD